MSERLNLLRSLLGRYARPYSVLDVGSGIEPNQNIGQEIAWTDPNAHVVSIEKDWSLDKFKRSPRTVILQKEFAAADLARLAECEQFDIVLCLNLLHWFDVSDGMAVMNACLKLGKQVVIQMPYPDEEAMGRETTKVLTSLVGGSQVGETSQFPGHRPRPIYVMRGQYHRLTRTHWDAHDNSADTDFGYDAPTQTALKATLKSGRIVQWIPGINLANFMKLGGVWPQRESILYMLENFNLPERNHGDVALHNFILDGERLHLIDGFEGWCFDDRENLAKVVQVTREAYGERA